MSKKNELDLNVTNVYDRNLKAIADGYTILLNQGGSGSSKTWSILQLLITRALENREERYTIGRQVKAWLTPTLLQDFKDITKLWKVHVEPEINTRRNEQQYFINGTEFYFGGFDHPEKLHGRRQDIFWLNEVMEIDKIHYDQLKMRTKKLAILDYNPYDDTHWVYGLHRNPEAKVIRSTMLDNKEHLPEQVVRTIYGYEPTEANKQNGTADSYLWDVYGLGKKAKLKGVIYDWDIVEEVPLEAKSLGLGLDFGYSDPSALIEMYMYQNELYVDELIYKSGLKNTSPYKDEETLEALMKALGVGSKPIVADSAEPKSIAELKACGFNIRGAKKGQDSVNYGIKLLQRYKVHITRKSLNVENESRKYKWAEDSSGNMRKDSKGRPVAIDDFNHCFVGNTQIMTDKGSIAIKDIRAGDRVLTRGGYHRVTRHFDNGIRPVLTYRIASNNMEVTLRATQDHKILVNKKWKKIKELKKGDRIYLHGSMVARYIPSTQEKGISAGVADDCTELSGKILTEQSQRGMMFTIKTLIRQIINWRIWRYCRSQNIGSDIKKGDIQKSKKRKCERILGKMQDQKLLNGIKVKKVGNGIKSRRKEAMLRGNSSLKFVNTVEKSTKQDTGELVSIVIQTVNRLHEGAERVYDLEVDCHHEYFANGVLVHNCLDAVRYLATDVLEKKGKTKILPTGTIA